MQLHLAALAALAAGQVRQYNLCSRLLLGFLDLRRGVALFASHLFATWAKQRAREWLAGRARPIRIRIDLVIY